MTDNPPRSARPLRAPFEWLPDRGDGPLDEAALPLEAQKVLRAAKAEATAIRRRAERAVCQILERAVTEAQNRVDQAEDEAAEVERTARASVAARSGLETPAVGLRPVRDTAPGWLIYEISGDLNLADVLALKQSLRALPSIQDVKVSPTESGALRLALASDDHRLAQAGLRSFPGVTLEPSPFDPPMEAATESPEDQELAAVRQAIVSLAERAAVRAAGAARPTG